MSSPYQNFKALIDNKLSTLGDAALPDNLPMLDLLSFLDESPAKTGVNKAIAKAHFELANSRHDLVKFAQQQLDLFWASAARMPHPYGLQPLLGYQPSLISHPNGFSVFLQHSPQDQRMVLDRARERNPDRYVASLLRLMASGTLNGYHVMEVIQQKDLSVFTQPAYEQLLRDFAAGREGLPSSTARNRHSLAEVFWLAGYPDLAKELVSLMDQAGRPDQLMCVKSALSNALMAGKKEFLAQSISMLADLYGIEEQDEVIDQALNACFSMPSNDQDLLFKFLLNRARQAHELGMLDRIRFWLPNYLSKIDPQVVNTHGPGFLWTVLALNPAWISEGKSFCGRMSDAGYLRCVIGHTDPQSWKDLVIHSAGSSDAMFSMLADLDIKTVKELKIEGIIVDLFLDGVASGRDERLAGISGDQSGLWKSITDTTEKLAGALGEYCNTDRDEVKIARVFESLTHSRYRRAFLEPLPRFPALLQQLPASERDRLMSADLGL